MSLNEKTFQQILSLHSKGLGEDASLLGILQLIYGHEDHREAVRWIKRFYQDITLISHKSWLSSLTDTEMYEIRRAGI